MNLVQTLTSLLTSWPRETFSGFMVHFTNRWRVKMKLLRHLLNVENVRNLDPLSEYSTIDTSECVLGALFAGNYFGGEVTL